MEDENIKRKPVLFACLQEDSPFCWLVKVPNRTLLLSANDDNNKLILDYNESEENLEEKRYQVKIACSKSISWLGTDQGNTSDIFNSYALIELEDKFLAFPLDRFINFQASIERDEEFEAKLTERIQQIEVIDISAQKQINQINNSDIIIKEEKLNKSNISAANSKDKKVLTNIKKKNIHKDVDKRNSAKSTLSISKIERTDADWDYSDGINSDDEDVHKEKSDEEVFEKKNFLDTDSENEELTTYGTKLTNMLAKFNEISAEKELQNASDSDDNKQDDSNNSEINNNKNYEKQEIIKNNATDSKIGFYTCNSIKLQDKAEIDKKIKNALINYVKDHPGCELKNAITALNLDVKGSRIEVIRNVVRDYFNVSISKLPNGQKIRRLFVKE